MRCPDPHERMVGPRMKLLTQAFTRNFIKTARAMGEEELSVVHGHVIAFLYWNRDQDVYQRDIEEEFHITRSSVTGVVQLMEKKGYITRRSVEADARLKKLTLTEKGVASCEHTMAAMKQVEAQAVRGLTRDQLDAFFDVCDVIQHNLTGKECDRP